MSKIVDAVLNNPVELIACLAFLPLFLMYPGITVANLFVLISLALSYFLFLSGKKPLQLTAPFVLLFSLLIYLFAAYENFSYIFVALAILGSLGLVYSAMRYGINDTQGKTVRRLFVAGLAIMILLPIVFRLSLTFLLNSERKNLAHTALDFQSKMKQDNDQIAQKASEMSSDPFVLDLLDKKNYVDLASYAQNLMVAKDLDYLTLTDSSDMVVARAHRLKAVGDDYSKIIVNIKDGSPSSGIYYEDNRAFLAALTPLQKQGQPKLGSMIAGRFISDGYLRSFLKQESGIAFYSQLTIFGSSANSPLLKDFIDQAKNQSKLDQATGKVFDFKNQKIMLVASDLSGGAGKLLYFRPINLWRQSFTFNLIFFCCLLLAVFIYLKIKTPSAQEQSTKLSRLFSRHKSGINLKNLLLNSVEFLLLVSILALLWWRSSVNYYRLGFDYQKITENKLTELADASPSLQLGLNSYVKVDEVAKVKLLINNLKDAPASVQLLLKFDPAKVKDLGIDYSAGICDRVHDNIADNAQGLVSFSCDLNNISASGMAQQEVATVSFKTLQSGVAAFSLDENYSYILTSKGKKNVVVQSFKDGEHIIMSE